MEDQEILIVLTPHILRFPSITADDLRTMAAGTDTNVRVYREDNETPGAWLLRHGLRRRVMARVWTNSTARAASARERGRATATSIRPT